MRWAPSACIGAVPAKAGQFPATQNHPTVSTKCTFGPTTTNTTYSIPLTVSGLAGELGQQLSLGLDSSSSDGLDLNSKEAGSTAAPKLVLTLKK